MKKVINLTILLVLCVLLNSCVATVIGKSFVGGKTTQFSGKYELTLKTSKEKTIADLKKSLFKLGFKTTSNTDLQFDKSNGEAEGYGLNKFYSTTVDAKIEETKLIISILQTGNYQHGTEEKTNETFEKIKTEYLK